MLFDCLINNIEMNINRVLSQGNSPQKNGFIQQNGCKLSSINPILLHTQQDIASFQVKQIKQKCQSQNKALSSQLSIYQIRNRFQQILGQVQSNKYSGSSFTMSHNQRKKKFSIKPRQSPEVIKHRNIVKKEKILNGSQIFRLNQSVSRSNTFKYSYQNEMNRSREISAQKINVRQGCNPYCAGAKQIKIPLKKSQTKNLDGLYKQMVALKNQPVQDKNQSSLSIPNKIYKKFQNFKNNQQCYDHSQNNKTFLKTQSNSHAWKSNKPVCNDNSLIDKIYSNYHSPTKTENSTLVKGKQSFLCQSVSWKRSQRKYHGKKIYIKDFTMSQGKKTPKFETKKMSTQYVVEPWQGQNQEQFCNMAIENFTS